MTIIHTERGDGIAQQRCITKTRMSCVLLTGGVLIVGVALSIVPHIVLAKPATVVETSSTKEQQLLSVQEDPYSLGCYVDDRSSHIMPYVYTDKALTPLVSDIML